MKNVSLFLLPLLFLLPAIYSFNYSNIKNDVGDRVLLYVEPVSNAKSFVLRLANLQRLSTQIIIKDRTGNVYYSETVTGRNGYRKLINLENLEVGFYMLEIVQEDGKRSKAMILKHGEIRFLGMQKTQV